MSDFNEDIEYIKSHLAEIEIYNFITRDKELQKEACTRICKLLVDIRVLKERAISKQDEDLANLFLGFECASQFLHAEISMWMLLKDEQPDEAWRHLVSAQRAASDAVRAHSEFAHLRQHLERLDVIEKTVFPPQVFTSLGLIVRLRVCSICGTEYGECVHLVGKPYNGEICRTIVKEIEKIDHIAIVEEPANKNCRIIKFSVPGGVRNRMTWKVELVERSGRDQQAEAGVIAEAVLYGPGEVFE